MRKREPDISLVTLLPSGQPFRECETITDRSSNEHLQRSGSAGWLSPRRRGCCGLGHHPWHLGSCSSSAARVGFIMWMIGAGNLGLRWARTASPQAIEIRSSAARRHGSRLPLLECVRSQQMF